MKIEVSKLRKGLSKVQSEMGFIRKSDVNKIIDDLVKEEIKKDKDIERMIDYV